jgi:hypothetical protein
MRLSRCSGPEDSCTLGAPVAHSKWSPTGKKPTVPSDDNPYGAPRRQPPEAAWAPAPVRLSPSPGPLDVGPWGQSDHGDVRGAGTKSGNVLRTIADARAYMVAMPAAHDGCARWLHAAKLILGQADGQRREPAGPPRAVL